MADLLETVQQEQKTFLSFLKTRFTLYHDSNVFFRDIHYGVMTYLEMKGKRFGYTEAEKVARSVCADLEQQGIFRRIDAMTFTLIYPEFKKPPVKPAVPASKPSAPAAVRPAPAPAAKPVAGDARPAASAQTPSSKSTEAQQS